MTATMTRKVSFGLILTMMLTLMFAFMSPMESHATAAPPATSAGDDIGGVKVEVTNGKLNISGNTNFSNGGTDSAWNALFTKYRSFIVGISGIGAISMIVFFVIQFMKLGASAGNPQARSQALAGVLWTGIAAAGLGAVTIVVGFFYNSIK